MTSSPFLYPGITEPLPGDIEVCSVGGPVGTLIGLGERLAGSGFSQYQHARIYVGLVPGVGQHCVVQAEPGGCQLRPLHSFHQEGYDLWSTGSILLTTKERNLVVAAAMRYAELKVPYSDADYLAIAAHRWHLPVPGLEDFIKDDGHMICSQLDDRAFQCGGVQLFSDKRWDGYVMPGDLAGVIMSRPGWDLPRIPPVPIPPPPAP